ncbi:MAG: class I SAM-dependent methyltransferase [Elusimicrobia bacterium]|nr:class I SAM-dependent methyltransferase [Elusimicrobiota bacterium]
MKRLLDFVTPLHKRTTRDYLGRMNDGKIDCMRKAREYEFDYWDGDRRCGYGGYRYDGRWKPVAERMISFYKLGPGARILDVGCGKAHLLYELGKLLPGAEVAGIDISKHGLGDAPAEIRPRLTRRRAQDAYPWADAHFDLVISLACLHNLHLFELETALKEIERVGRSKYVMVESYRSEAELFNLQCWALTCQTFLDTADWTWLFSHFGYTGDHEFIFFE